MTSTTTIQRYLAWAEGRIAGVVVREGLHVGQFIKDLQALVAAGVIHKNGDGRWHRNDDEGAMG